MRKGKGRRERKSPSGCPGRIGTEFCERMGYISAVGEARKNVRMQDRREGLVGCNIYSGRIESVSMRENIRPLSALLNALLWEYADGNANTASKGR